MLNPLASDSTKINPQQDKGSLRKVYPQLVRTWHPKRNLKSTKDVNASSCLVYWWKCPKGPDHEWSDTIKSRLLKPLDWCPCCLNMKVSKTNSLRSISPQLSKQWHPTLNKIGSSSGGGGSDRGDGDMNMQIMKPENVLSTSRSLIWWKCPKGADHIWQETIETRMKNMNINIKQKHKEKEEKQKLQKQEQNNQDDNNKMSQKKKMKNDKNNNYKSEDDDKGEDINDFITDCPCCCNLQVSQTNNLLCVYPEIAVLWHPIKNTVRVDNQKKNNKNNHLRNKNIILKPNLVLANSKGSCWLRCHPSSKGHDKYFKSLEQVIINYKQNIHKKNRNDNDNNEVEILLENQMLTDNYLCLPFLCHICSQNTSQDIITDILNIVFQKIDRLRNNKEEELKLVKNNVNNNIKNNEQLKREKIDVNQSIKIDVTNSKDSSSSSSGRDQTKQKKVKSSTCLIS